MTEYLLIALLGLLVIAVVLLIVLLVRQSRLNHDQEQQNRQIADYLKNFGYDVFDELDAQRDGNTAAMQQTGDRITAAMSHMGQSQTALLESMQRQLLLSTRNQEERIGQMATGVNETLAQLDARMEQVRRATAEGLDALRQENTRQLTEMRRSVDERLTQSLDKRLNDSFALVSQRLEQVYKGLGEMQTLATGVGDLKRVLSNVKTRGVLGEVQLGAILEQILAPEQYEANVKTRPGSTHYVEFAVKLPGTDEGAIWLPIDAKFPADAYAQLLDAYEAGDAEMVKAAGTVLEQRIRSFAKDIRDKYVAPPHTTDFGIMFLPVEGLYAEVVRRGLIEVLQRDYHVNIAGPTTMAALLNSLQMGFKTLAIQKRSGEVWKLLGAVKTEFDRFGDVIAAAQQRLEQAGNELDKLVGVRTRQIQRKLAGITSLAEGEAAALLAEGDSGETT